jgi:hypothetical protein
VVQVIPSSNSVINKIDFSGGGVGAGDFVLTSNSEIVLRHGPEILSQIATIPEAQFVEHNSRWSAIGDSALILLKRKNKLPLIAFPQYGSSNGSDYHIYSIQQQQNKFQITPVDFSGMCMVIGKMYFSAAKFKCFTMNITNEIICVLMVTIIH